MKKLALILALALILTLPGCGKKEVSNPNDSVSFRLTGHGIELYRTDGEMTFSSLFEYSKSVWYEYIGSFVPPEPAEENYFSLSDAALPAYGSIYPNQPREDYMSAIFNVSELPPEVLEPNDYWDSKDISRNPCMIFPRDSARNISLSGVFAGLPFKLTVTFREFNGEECVNVIILDFDYLPDKLSTEDALKAWVTLRDTLIAQLGPTLGQKSTNDPHYIENEYLDISADELIASAPAGELPSQFGVSWGHENTSLVVITSFYEDGSLSHLRIALDPWD